MATTTADEACDQEENTVPTEDTNAATTVYPDWHSVVKHQDAGPDVALLHESAELKVVLVALSPGQALPPHPGPAASFHIVSGDGVVVVDGVEHAVSAGATVIAPPGAHRSVRSITPLVFLGNLGDPASEDGPH
jgi:quercetin dioxygenase-like cupin family protein